jgi:anaerobic selenocysteine-containing dehydrogenase
MYAASEIATSTHGMGGEQLLNCIETLHAIYALPVVTGNINVKGGETITGPHRKKMPIHACSNGFR